VIRPRLQPRQHRLLPHTADAGLEATAPDLSALFEEAGCALAEVAADLLPGAAAAAWEDIVVSAGDLPALAYAWLNELVALAEVRHAALVAVSVDGVDGPLDDRAGGWRLRGRIGLSPLGDPGVRSRHQVKSATFHGLVVQRAGDGWILRAYLDL
jgi:SHS2 domain-containing protein